MGTELISAPEHVTSERLTELLRGSGAVKMARVVDVQSTPIGNGLLGDSLRFTITYDRVEQGAPKTLAGKFPTSDPSARQAASQTQIYLNEVRFYQQIASRVGINTPRALYAEIDTRTMAFGLLMEDLGPARGGDQLLGATLEDAYLALDQAAALHAPLWNSPELLQIDWLNAGREINHAIVAQFPQLMATFHERFDGVLEVEHMAICDAYSARVADFVFREPPQRTVIHKDFRLDNMLFDAKAGAIPLAVLDWQTVACGPGPLDAAYFIGLCLPRDIRTRYEGELFDYYLNAVQWLGRRDLDRDMLWREYRISAHYGVFTAIVGSSLAKRTARGDQMFMNMARGGCGQMRDLETLTAL